MVPKYILDIVGGRIPVISASRFCVILLRASSTRTPVKSIMLSTFLDLCCTNISTVGGKSQYGARKKYFENFVKSIDKLRLT